MKQHAGILASLNEEEKNVFGIIQKRGPMTKNTLVDLTGLKLTTLNRVMEPLERHALIEEAGLAESSGGRRPLLYDVHPRSYFAIGIDISRTYTQVVITNLKMAIQYRRRFPMDESCSPEKTVKRIADIVFEGCNTLGLDIGSVLGVGVGIVGPFDRDAGMIKNPVNFASPGWQNVPIRKMLEDALRLPVYIDNGANTSVLAEFLYGDGRNMQHIAYFNCGVGIRTGVISSGVIVRPISNTEDAFGHIVVDVDGDLCSCGNYGCIECYASIPSIVKKFTSSIKRGRQSSVARPLDEIDYRDICSAAASGDELAREVIIGAATIMGAGLANFVNLLNPQLVILSGPLVSSSELFYEISIQTALKKYYIEKDHPTIYSKGGHFADNAIAVGAAAMVVENFLDSRVLG